MFMSPPTQPPTQLPRQLGALPSSQTIEQAVSPTRSARRWWQRAEWPTIGLFVLVYSLIPCLLWFCAVSLPALRGALTSFDAHIVFILASLAWLSVIYLTVLHASLQHEALHGHPFRNSRWNTALAALPMGLFVPYNRFKQLHLRHHCNENLTDPYDDPESFYLAKRDWQDLPAWLTRLLMANNTLLGRLTLGPTLALFAFYRCEYQLYRTHHNRRAHLRRIWVGHGVLVAFILTLAGQLGISPVVYICAIAYPAMSLLMLRTFAEHQAAEAVGPRTAVIEAHPVFALLYLNNNLHFVHHRFPNAPWYHLPGLYRRYGHEMLVDNEHYHIKGYSALFRNHLLSAKEPVIHPFRRLDQE